MKNIKPFYEFVNEGIRDKMTPVPKSIIQSKLDGLPLHKVQDNRQDIIKELEQYDDTTRANKFVEILLNGYFDNKGLNKFFDNEIGKKLYEYFLNGFDIYIDNGDVELIEEALETMDWRWVMCGSWDVSTVYSCKTAHVWVKKRFDKN